MTVDRQRLSSIAHSHHPIAAPVFGANVNRLLRRAGRQPTARILDLGCGEAAWAMHALAQCPDGHADCVDVSPYALERAAAAAADRGLAERLTLHDCDARRYWPDGDYDLVLCVGSTHVFGGFAETLRQAGRHVNADGILLVGEGFWQVPPTARALAALDASAEDFTDLAGLVDVAEQAAWTPVYAHVSDTAEWDNYEWSWVGSVTEWALDNPGHPDAAGVLALARKHRDEWLRGYRNVLGFATLVLRRTQPPDIQQADLPSLAMDFDRFTVALLVLRDDAPELTAEQEDALQDAHMSYLADLHQSGHLLAAGPLLDRRSEFRGLSILNVGAEEARALKERDPAVQAGRYAVVVLPWMVPAGAMSFSPARFPRSAAEARGS